MSQLYYEPCDKKIYDEIVAAAKLIRTKYDDTYGYVSDKLSEIDNLNPDGSNVMVIVRMFDMSNQRKHAALLSPQSRMEIKLREIAGGAPLNFIPY